MKVALCKGVSPNAVAKSADPKLCAFKQFEAVYDAYFLLGQRIAKRFFFGVEKTNAAIISPDPQLAFLVGQYGLNDLIRQAVFFGKIDDGFTLAGKRTGGNASIRPQPHMARGIGHDHIYVIARQAIFTIKIIQPFFIEKINTFTIGRHPDMAVAVLHKPIDRHIWCAFWW